MTALVQPLRLAHADTAPSPRGDDLPGVILLAKALRVWTAAQAGVETSPREALAAFLASRGFGGLAGAFDTLFAAADALAGRALETGCGCSMSSDEAWLACRLGLQREGGSGPEGSEEARARFEAAAGAAQALWRLARAGRV